MTEKQASSFLGRSKRVGMLLIAVAAVSMPAASFATEVEATASERAACTPDVFRLCGSEIPNVNRIVACMVAKKDRLSAPCKSVFAKRERERELTAAQNSR